MGRPKSNKPKPTIKGKRGRPRKNNPTHPSHDIDNDVGHEVENLLQEQNSNISEEEDEIEWRRGQRDTKETGEQTERRTDRLHYLKMFLRNCGRKPSQRSKCGNVG